MARKLGTAAPSRRDFLKTAGLFGGIAAGGWPEQGHAQGLKTITASHSVSTFVYGHHLVAAQKKFFEGEGVKTPDFIVPGGVVMTRRPGRVKLIYEVTLPRPRDVIRLRETAEYLREYGEIWHALGEEFQERAS